MPHRRVADLPRIGDPEALSPDQLSNAALFALLEACEASPTTAVLDCQALASRDITDAHLAALAIAHGWRLVTFDRGFGRFAGLVWLEP
ncbi:MAG: PIN domain-containing protein [Cyanobacteriota bacterium]